MTQKYFDIIGSLTLDYHLVILKKSFVYIAEHQNNVQAWCHCCQRATILM